MADRAPATRRRLAATEAALRIWVLVAGLRRDRTVSRAMRDRAAALALDVTATLMGRPAPAAERLDRAEAGAALGALLDALAARGLSWPDVVALVTSHRSSER